MVGLTLSTQIACYNEHRLTKASSFNFHVHGMRGLLALMVFGFHVASSGLPSFAWLGGSAAPVSPLLYLQYGVEIFFCISGTIVVGALERAGSPCHFLWDRIIRIMPVLWATLAIIVPLGFLTHQAAYAHYTAHNIGWIVPANMLALPGVLPLPLLHMGAWSLSYEFAFYLVAALAWSVMPRHRLLKIACFLLIGSLIAWQPRAIFFAIGVLVERSDLSRHPAMGRAIRWPFVWLIVFAALWHMVTVDGADGGAGSLLLWVQNGRIGFAALAVSAAILAWAGIVEGYGILGKMLRYAPIQWLGSVSYSFYLWHLIVLAILKRAMTISGTAAHLGAWSQFSLLIAGLPISLLVAHTSLCLIERRFTCALKPWRPAQSTFHGRAAGNLEKSLTTENTASLAA